MQLRHRQTISAVILLLVMIMSLGVRALHVHHYAERPAVECQDCRQHIYHSGHLMAATDGKGDCVLCQLLTLPFVGEDTRDYQISFTSRIAQFRLTILTGYPCLVQIISLRAPPAFR